MQYLKRHKIAAYTELLYNDKLHDYLADVNDQAEEMLFQLVKQMAKVEGITKKLKATNQMEWGAGLRRRPLPKAEAPTEPAGETAA